MSGDSGYLSLPLSKRRKKKREKGTREIAKIDSRAIVS